MNGKQLRIVLVAGLAIAAAAALYDAIRMPDDGPYRKVPHGDHVHYVPKDRDPAAHLDDFPTKLPPPGFRIGPDGAIVKE